MNITTYTRVAKHVWRTRWLRNTILVLVCIPMIFLMMMTLLSSPVVLLTGAAALLMPTPETRTSYVDASSVWEKNISWFNPITHAQQVGLTNDLIQQVQQLRIQLSPGLLLALSELGPGYSSDKANELSALLSPRDLQVESFDTTVTTETTPTQQTETDDGGTPQPTTTTTHTPVLRIVKVKTYNGVYTFTYSMKSTVTETSSETEKTKVTKTVPVVSNEQLDPDLSTLNDAMQKVGLYGSSDLSILYKQALALDSSFNDPDALKYLPDLEMDDGGGAFTGTFTGPYSIQTVITEDSGVTVQQIEKLLAGTPMAGCANDFYEAGRKYGIDPAFLVGIAGAEQSFDPYNNNAFGITGEGDAGSVGGFAAYSSMQVGIYAAARLMSGPLYVKDGLTTIEQIWHRWAPDQASNDPNNLNSNWGANVVMYMNKLKSM